MVYQLKTILKRINEFLKSQRGEAVRYVIIGGCTTLVDYLSYQLMVAFLHVGVTASNVVSTVLAILFAYVTNKLIVFNSRTSCFAELALEFFKFIVSRLFTMMLELGGVYLFVTFLGQDYRLGKAETIVIVIIVNYVLSKLVVFRKTPSKH
jgi:putative flippase GtrA